MFKWVHLIASFCTLIRKICGSICNVFNCPEHSKNESEEN